MKKLLFLLPLVALFISCAGPQQRSHFTAPSFVPVNQSVTNLVANNKASQTHAEKAKKAIDSAEKADSPKILKLALEDAKGEIDALTKILLDDAAQQQVLEGQVKDLTTQVERQTNVANQVIDDNNKLIATNLKLAKQAKIDADHVHRLKFWLCSAGAAIGLFLVFQFSSLLMAFGPWGFLAYAIVPGIIFATLWRIL
jgi:hypothetical protein